METILPQDPAEVPAAEPPAINVQDLMVLRSCMQVAAQRGAFRAEEMQNVGRAFDKLDAFLKFVEKPPAPTPADAPVGNEDAGQPTQGE